MNLLFLTYEFQSNWLNNSRAGSQNTNTLICVFSADIRFVKSEVSAEFILPLNNLISKLCSHTVKFLVFTYK